MNFDVTFQPPSVLERNGQINNYTLFYQRVSVSNVVSADMERSITLPRNSSNQGDNFIFSVSGLEENSTYQLSLEACNTNGECLRNNSVASRTTLSAGKRGLCSEAVAKVNTSVFYLRQYPTPLRLFLLFLVIAPFLFRSL